MSDETTALEIEHDEGNIRQIHERKSLLSDGKKKIKQPGCKTACWKAVVIVIAIVVFVLMLVEVWKDYGSYITKKVNRPVIYSYSQHCPNSTNVTMKKPYNAPTCDFLGTTNDDYRLSCKIELSENMFVETCSRHGAYVVYDDKDTFSVHWKNIHTDCTIVKIWDM